MQDPSTPRMTADEFIAREGEHLGIREYLGDFQGQYTDEDISEIASRYQDELRYRRDDIAAALASLDSDVTPNYLPGLFLNCHLDEAIQQFEAERNGS